MARVLITNNGSHSPDNWAMATAEQIVQTDPTMGGDRLLAAEKLKIAIAEVLITHYAALQNDERNKLIANVEHITTPHNAEEYVNSIIRDIVAAAKGSPWAPHYSKPEVQDVVRQITTSHLQTAQHVERLWHADNNPDCSVSQSYKQFFHAKTVA